MAKTWEFQATVTLQSVRVYVEAETVEEAREKALALDHVDEEIGGASWADIRLTSKGERVDDED